MRTVNVLEGPDGETEPDPWFDPTLVAATERYLGTLPHDLLAVHRQRYVLGLSQEAAARVLSLTRQNVRTLEKRLRKGLIRALSSAGLHWPRDRRFPNDRKPC